MPSDTTESAALPPVNDDAPPAEEFWEKFSPRHEFGLSWVGSLAIHLGLFLLFLFCVRLLSSESLPDAPPMRPVVVFDPSATSNLGGAGSDGGPMENVPEVKEFEIPPPIPEAKLQEVKDRVQAWTPETAIDPALVEQLAQSPNLDKLSKVSDALRKSLVPGTGGGGSGTTPNASGNSKGSAPDSTTGRALRWSLNFTVESGEEWLRQFAALGGTLLFEIGRTGEAIIIRDPLKPENAERISNYKELKELYFIDDNRRSVLQLAQACRLDFSPPRFIAYFPKSFENRLAQAERNYRGKNEGDIIETEFRIVVRNGQPEITVLSQKARR